MNNFVKRLLVSGGVMATVAVASSTVAFAADTTSQPWTAGQVVDIWGTSPGGDQPSSVTIYLNYMPVTATKIASQPDSNIPFLTISEYQFTVPNVGTTGTYFMYAKIPGGSAFGLYSGPSLFDTMISTVNYVQPAVGQLPEVPFAGALPFIGLAGVGALLFARKRKKVVS